MNHIFISYAHKNGEIAASLASQLDDLGLKVFLAERNLNPGENWEPAIREALKSSKLVLCLITPESKTSGWVHAEAGAACSRVEERRGNGALKDNYGGRFVRVRSPEKVFCHLMFGVLALTAEQLMRLVA